MPRKKKEKGLWDDVKKWLSDATKTAVKEAEDLTRKGKLKMQILSLNRKIEKSFAELGGFIYETYGKKKDTPFDSKIKERFRKIKRLESQLRKKKGEWEKSK